MFIFTCQANFLFNMELQNPRLVWAGKDREAHGQGHLVSQHPTYFFSTFVPKLFHQLKASLGEELSGGICSV